MVPSDDVFLGRLLRFLARNFRVNDSGSQVASKPISSVCLKITRSGEIANSFGFPGFVVVDDGLFGGVERKKERMGSRA
jgi:hypothetical protein